MYTPPSADSYLEFPSPPYPLSVKHASIEDLLNISYWLWRLNPLSIFPVLLGSAAEVLKQSIIVIALMFSLSQLTTSGIFRDLAESISTLDFPRMISIVSPIIHVLKPVLFVTISIYYVASIIAGGFLNSAEYGSYLRLLKQGKIYFRDILEEMGGKWIRISWTVFMIETIKMIPQLIAISVILSDIVYLASHELESLTFWKVLGWLSILTLAQVVVIVLSVFTLYAYPAAADGSYGLAAIRKSVNTCFKMPANTFLYCVLRVTSNVLIGVISLIASLLSIQISSILAIILSFLIIPVFHICKTALFLKVKPEDTLIPLPIGPPVLEDMFPHILNAGFEKVRKGFRKLASFLAEIRNIVFHILSAMFLFLGVILGKQISSSGIRQVIYALGYVPGEFNPMFKNVLGLPFLALDISFHNWQVSLATAISGIIFIIPVLTTLFFNGFILGVAEDIVQNIRMFLAAVLPHGIIELPAFVIAGSIGLNLGFEFLKSLKNRNVISNEVFHECLKETIYMVISLIPLFIIAGIIEAFITPLIMRMYGWT